LRNQRQEAEEHAWRACPGLARGEFAMSSGGPDLIVGDGGKGKGKAAMWLIEWTRRARTVATRSSTEFRTHTPHKPEDENIHPLSYALTDRRSR